MTKRRRRTKVVIDTNVFVGNFLTSNLHSFNRRVIRLWLIERRLKLALSSEVQEEYSRIFDEVLGFVGEQMETWRGRFSNRKITESVKLGSRPRMSRDVADNIFIATAMAAKARFLVTNDNDLLEIAESDKRRLKFKIVPPQQLLEYLENPS